MHRIINRPIFMKIMGFFALYLSFSPVSAATFEFEGDGDRQEILALIDRTFDAVTSGDPAAWKNILSDDSVLISFRADPEGKEGQQIMQSITAKDYMASLRPRKDAYYEAFTDKPQIQISGNIANVWAHYGFWINDQFSHCGVDNFSLVKVGDKWKIAALTWTVVRENCPVTKISDLKPS